jgi:hypothetical protein
VGDHRLDARHAARDITDAIEEGTSTDDLADQLEENYAFSEARAETIARTEVATADVEGNLQAYRDSGVVEGKEWILGSEHPDIGCECEDAADMGVVPLDDDFGGIGDPPAHPNCECDMLPVDGTRTRAAESSLDAHRGRAYTDGTTRTAAGTAAWIPHRARAAFS